MSRGARNLREVYFMLRCTRKSHCNCTPMRNAAMRSSRHILKAYTTNIELEGERYCVTGRALVRTGDLNSFRAGLRAVRTRSSNPAGVERLMVLVAEQH